MDVAIIGATGDVGRQVVHLAVRDRLLPPSARLQLVGRPQSMYRLEGFAADLREAYAETAPQIDVATRPEDIVADIVVMIAGATPLVRDGRIMMRQELAGLNEPILRQHARALAAHGAGHEIVLVVTNPVELGVAIFAEELGDRHRVIGMGAFNDSLRFRAELASDLHVRRQLVQAFVVGEHGNNIVPLWSSIRVFGMEAEELRERLRPLRGDAPLRDYHKVLVELAKPLLGHLERGELREAYAYVEGLQPHFRFVLRNMATHFSGAKTVCASARSTIDFLGTMLGGGEQVLAGQMMLDGEFHGLRGPLGVPLLVSKGIRGIAPLEMDDEEVRVLKWTSRQVNDSIAPFLATKPKRRRAAR